MHVRASCLLATAKNCNCKAEAPTPAAIVSTWPQLWDESLTITCQRAPVLCGLAAFQYIVMTGQYIRQAVATVGRRRQLQPQSPTGNAVPYTNRPCRNFTCAAVHITLVPACFVLCVSKAVCLCWVVHDLCLIHLFRK